MTANTTSGCRFARLMWAFHNTVWRLRAISSRAGHPAHALADRACSWAPTGPSARLAVMRTPCMPPDPSDQSATRRSRSALAMTETELRLIAAPAIIGLRNQPKNG